MQRKKNLGGKKKFAGKKKKKMAEICKHSCDSCTCFKVVETSKRPFWQKIFLISATVHLQPLPAQLSRLKLYQSNWDALKFNQV
jgi:hypothetical protein